MFTAGPMASGSLRGPVPAAKQAGPGSLAPGTREAVRAAQVSWDTVTVALQPVVLATKNKTQLRN